MKKIIYIPLFVVLISLLHVGSINAAPTSTVVQNLIFFDDILPDNSLCNNGQILKKTASTDWDCATDNTGGGGTLSTSTQFTAGEIVIAHGTSTIHTTSSLSIVSSTGLFQNFAISSSTELRSPSGSITGLSFNRASGTNLTLSGYGQVAGDLFVTGSIGASANRITKLWATDIDSTNGTIGTISISSAVSGDLVINSGDVNIASTTKAFKIGGTNVLTTNALGSGILSSSLTSLGTITSLLFTNATGSANLTVNSLNITNGNEYRKHTASIIVMNPSVVNHATGTVFFVFPVDATLLSLRCHSTPSGTSTIAVDRRSSSTPSTAGQAVVASQACGSSASTITFTSSTVPAGEGLNFTFNPVAGSPSSTVIFVDYLNND